MGNATSFKPGQGGRRAGTPNRLTKAFRGGLLYAYNQLGGKTAMAEWARANPTEFYRICSRLIPTEIAIDVKAESRTLVIDMVTSRAELEAAHTAQEDEPLLFDDDVVAVPEPRPSLVPASVPEPDPPDVPHFS